MGGLTCVSRTSVSLWFKLWPLVPSSEPQRLPLVLFLLVSTCSESVVFFDATSPLPDAVKASNSDNIEIVTAFMIFFSFGVLSVRFRPFASTG
jgi:hypothetical protein